MQAEGLPGGAFACGPSSDRVGGILAQVLRTFDSLISSNCTQELENTGVDVWKHTQVGMHRAALRLAPSLLQRQVLIAVLGAACWATVLQNPLFCTMAIVACCKAEAICTFSCFSCCSP